MCYLFRRLFYEETSAYQLAVAIRPNKDDVTITENVALRDNSVWIYLVKLRIPGFRVVLKVGYPDDFHPLAEAALVVVHAVAEFRKGANRMLTPHTHISCFSGESRF